ncbi:643_t:CDS:1, partial [Entrophospora sp. SA101]
MVFSVAKTALFYVQMDFHGNWMRKIHFTTILGDPPVILVTVS